MHKSTSMISVASLVFFNLRQIFPDQNKKNAVYIFFKICHLLFYTGWFINNVQINLY